MDLSTYFGLFHRTPYQYQGHVEHDDLQQYGVEPLTDALKILWCHNRITDKSLDAVRASINATPTSFTTFPAVQEAYVSFKLQQKQIEPTRGRQVASVKAGKQRSSMSRSGRGRGQGGGDRKRGIFSPEELAACKVENRDYSTEEYQKVTDLQRQKLYPGAVLGTGPTRQIRRGGHGRNDNASIASTNTSGTKRLGDDIREVPEEGDDQNSSGWGRNCTNPAVMGRQGVTKAQKLDAET